MPKSANSISRLEKNRALGDVRKCFRLGKKKILRIEY